MVVMYYAFLFSLLFLNQVLNRKYENIFWLIGAGFAWFLCVFVNDNYVDWAQYQYIFNTSSTIIFTKDVGFGILCFLLNSAGFDAISLRVVIFSTGFLLLYLSLKKLNVNKILFLLLYSFYPLPSEAMHLRTCIVSFLLIYALISFLRDGNKVKYCLLILLAATFHKMAVFYMLFLLVDRIRENKKSIKAFLVFVGIFILVMGWGGHLTSQLSAVMIALNSTVELGNSTNSYGAGIENGWMIDWAVQLGFLVMLFFMQRRFSKEEDSGAKTSVKLIFWVNVVALIFLPFYFISFDYFRLFRNMLAVDYVAICLFLQMLFLCKDNTAFIKKFVSCVLVVALVGFTGYLKVGYRGRAPQEF